MAPAARLEQLMGKPNTWGRTSKQKTAALVT